MSCQHKQIKVTYLNDGVHHGRRDCIECGKFLRWIPKNKEFGGDQATRNKQIDRLLNNKPLNEFELNFLSSVRKYKDLSEKQQAVLHKTLDKYAKK